MKQPDDTVYPRHVLGAIARLDRYLTNVDMETFLENSMIQDGVIRQIQIIGEAIRRLSSAFRDRNPFVASCDIEQMRRILAHDYFGVDLVTVYETATNDLRTLEAQVRGDPPKAKRRVVAGMTAKRSYLCSTGRNRQGRVESRGPRQ